MNAVPTTSKVGLATGGGTGPEIAGVFERALSLLADAHATAFELIRSPRRYRSYFDVAALSAAAAAAAAAEDARAYEDFLLELAERGVRAVFRTAFNAESLYITRERLRAVKVERLAFERGEFLLVRDQAQGFYAGANGSPEDSPDRVVRTCEFRRDVTEMVLERALSEAAASWGGPGKAARIVAVYKYHLLDNRFARWVADFARARALRIELCQPDTMNRRLLRGEFNGNVLVIGSNEWLDIVHAELLARHGGLIQDERCARNLYLDPRLAGLEEYQTVHGSADDIAGLGIVDPLAALRAAAAIAERHGACAHAAALLDEAIAASRVGGTPGGQDTALVERRVLERYRRADAPLRGSCR